VGGLTAGIRTGLVQDGVAFTSPFAFDKATKRPSFLSESVTQPKMVNAA